MDNLETPYEADVDYIECKVCNKAVRGETLYKIHLTTLAHIKKEESLDSQDATVGQKSVPKFKDILEYLDYLKLDEPIIGLDCLEELPSDESLAGPNYSCNLCSAITNMSEMVHHVIGRKHRQRYVEVKRKDLVTWDNLPFPMKGGRIIRAKAQIIERQDGRGFPKALGKKGVIGKSNTSTAPPSVPPIREKRFLKRPNTVPPLLPEFRNYHNKHQNRRYPGGFQNPPRFYPNGENMEREGQHGFGFNQMEDGRHREEYMGSRDFGNDMESYYPGPSEEQFAEDPDREEPFGFDFLPRPDYREEMPCGQDYPSQCYQNKNPFKEPFPKRDAPREYFLQGERSDGYPPEHEPPQMFSEGENWSRNMDSSGYGPMDRSARQDLSEPESQMFFKGENWSKNMDPGGYGPKDRRARPDLSESESQMFSKDENWSRNMDSGGYGPMDRPARQDNMFSKDENWPRNTDPSGYGPMDRPARPDLSEPEAKRRIVSSPIDGGNRFSRVIKDYHHQTQGPHHGEAREEMEPNPSISNLPEIFQQFLSRVPNNDRRKRKTRFSDASPEEIQMTNEMISGPMFGKFDIDRRRGDKIDGLPYSGPHRESQNLAYTQSQRQAAESGDVFDMLQNVEIKTAEEAEFLKAKLCSLLREFKSRENEKVEQQQFRQQIESSLRKNSNLGPQNVFFEDNHTRAFNQRGHTPEGFQQEFTHSSLNEPRHSNRRPFEDDHRRALNTFGHTPEGMQQEAHHSSHNEFGHTNRSSFEAMERVQNSSLNKPPYRTERFQEPFQSRNYKPRGDELYDPFTMEEEYSVQRDSRYSSSLEKITSTLLELVSRKQQK